jgi:hypothetical protein
VADADHFDSPVQQNEALSTEARSRRCATCGKHCSTLSKLRRHVKRCSKRDLPLKNLSLDNAAAIACRRCGNRLDSSVSGPGEAVCPKCDNSLPPVPKNETSVIVVPFQGVDNTGTSKALDERTLNKSRTCKNCGKHYSRQSKFEQHTGTEGGLGTGILQHFLLIDLVCKCCIVYRIVPQISAIESEKYFFGSLTLNQYRLHYCRNLYLVTGNGAIVSFY